MRQMTSRWIQFLSIPDHKRIRACFIFQLISVQKKQERKIYALLFFFLLVVNLQFPSDNQSGGAVLITMVSEKMEETPGASVPDCPDLFDVTRR